MTKAQIQQKYQSQAIADQITSSKLSDEETKKTQTKMHPDCPTSEERDGALKALCYIKQFVYTLDLHIRLSYSWSK